MISSCQKKIKINKLPLIRSEKDFENHELINKTYIYFYGIAARADSTESIHFKRKSET